MTKQVCEKVHHTVKFRDAITQECSHSNWMDVVDRQCHTKNVEKCKKCF